MVMYSALCYLTSAYDGGEELKGARKGNLASGTAYSMFCCHHWWSLTAVLMDESQPVGLHCARSARSVPFYQPGLMSVRTHRALAKLVL